MVTEESEERKGERERRVQEKPTAVSSRVFPANPESETGKSSARVRTKDPSER